MGLIVAGAASTGGLAALAVKLSSKNRAGEVLPNEGKEKSNKNQDGEIFHTYSAYARGTETTISTYNYLDLVPKGRDEDALGFTMSWVRHHDRYDTGKLADPDKPYWHADAVPAS
jgi:predicted dithiol-disulfide oxidoreductase (DUF899 family)